MIYRCYDCRKLTFRIACPACDQDPEHPNKDRHIPLDPAYYPEFQYRSKGVLKDLFGKKKETAELNDLLKQVLLKYSELLRPYFVNFVYVSNFEPQQDSEIIQRGPRENATYSDLELFEEVLVRRGFKELRQVPSLLPKLLLTTEFNSEYFGFSREMTRYTGETLEDVLRSWIEEAGSSFRNNLHLFLYNLWENQRFTNEIEFDENARTEIDTPLVGRDRFSALTITSEKIYYDIQVSRLDVKLDRFDPSRFVTIHIVDAMDGFQFEDFLVGLFQTIGYDVQETKKTGDQGADLFVEKFGSKIVIQAKNYSGSVGNSAVQQALAAKAFYNCDQAMVVTNSYFTISAKELADSADVKLVDREALHNYLDDYNQQLIEQAATDN